MTDYELKFIELLVPLENVYGELSLGKFLNGLREDIKVEVRLLGPVIVDHAMELAHMVEDKFKYGKARGEGKQGISPKLIDGWELSRYLLGHILAATARPQNHIQITLDQAYQQGAVQYPRQNPWVN